MSSILFSFCSDFDPVNSLQPRVTWEEVLQPRKATFCRKAGNEAPSLPPLSPDWTSQQLKRVSIAAQMYTRVYCVWQCDRGLVSINNIKKDQYWPSNHADHWLESAQSSRNCVKIDWREPTSHCLAFHTWNQSRIHWFYSMPHSGNFFPIRTFCGPRKVQPHAVNFVRLKAPCIGRWDCIIIIQSSSISFDVQSRQTQNVSEHTNSMLWE